MSANIRRHFLSWDRPLLPQAVAWLVGDWAGDRPLDLSKILVIVPTRQSGRRLREALAGYAAKWGAAVFPPRVMLPESLITPTPTMPGVASRLESTLAWVDVFRSLELDEFRSVFPVDPPVQNFTWALRLADDFSRLQRTLSESGLSPADVPMKIGQDFPEIDRWQQIAALERLHREKLAAVGLRDPQEVRREFARDPELDPAFDRIVLLATPDPVPLALSVLLAHGRTRPIDIVVFAPPTEAAAFDGWGRPVDRAWANRVIDLLGFSEHVHLCADPAEQAGRVAALAGGYGEPEGILGVGVADGEVAPLLEAGFEEKGLIAYNPEGRRRAGDSFHQLLGSLAALARDESFATLEALARCPDFLDYLQARIGGNFSAARFLLTLDKLHSRHLPPTLAEARRQVERGIANAASDGVAGLVAQQTENRATRARSAENFAMLLPTLGLVAELRATLSGGTFPENAALALGEIFRGRRFDLSQPADAAMAEAIEAWMAVLRGMASAAKLTRVTTTECWELALRFYSEEVHYDDKPAGAVELQGWLELLWEDAPHLVVAGLNDGLVPETIVGDPFLPESLREKLGLKTNAARFARDAYVLQAIAAWRQTSAGNSEATAGRRDDGVALGRLDLLVGKTSVAGDPLRPSRLLLRCADVDLPQRVAFLFRSAASTRTPPPWRRAWQLAPPHVAPPEKVAVTALRAWLACPFRFYLSRVLRMEAVDPAKTELDAFDFGTICHSALEAMGLSSAMRDCTDAKVIREFLLAALDAEARNRFGNELTLPLIVQLESARQRLSHAAEVQAQTRSEGWVIERVEQPFELDIGGLIVSGKIDRIERNERDGACRVIDYKTSDQPVEPWQAHLRGLHRGETVSEFARFVLNGKEQVWSDLQLPLYLRAVQMGRVGPNNAAAEGVAGTVPSAWRCGYFNLPKAATATGIREWNDYAGEHADAAWSCAMGVAAAIRAGEFWPPNETIRPDYDPFGSLFHHGVADSVAWRRNAVVVDHSSPVVDENDRADNGGEELR